ncbi:unnamed protein product [Chilo suppressalis]|uniref:Protamine n=1 Tax=Chilo suppressalis TaxID=168631 RepID=A0ABN8BG50_CHISP|nr:unnamed protein product [Chilo suppressalis]
MGLDGGIEAGEDDKEKINQDVMLFLRKRSEAEVPRYATRLKTYVSLQHKRQRAAAARRHSEQKLKNPSGLKKKNVENNMTLETTENRGMGGEERAVKPRRGEKAGGVGSRSQSQSGEPVDKCGRRRRRRRSCCRRRRRRRRSCGRRRRRRSCSRRRRRRSCRRRRKRCRRRRRRC